MTYVHQWGNVHSVFVSLYFRNNLFFALDFSQIPCWSCREFFPFLVHRSLCIRNLHGLWHRDKLVHCMIMRSSCVLDCKDSDRCLVDSMRFHNTTIHFLNSFSSPIFGFAPVFTMVGCLLHFTNFFLRFWEFLNTLCHPDRWSKYLSVFEHCQASISFLPIPAFLDSERLYQFSSKILAIHDPVW